MTSAFAITTDEFLVGRARSGDLEALEAVYRAYEAPVYNLARRLCRRPEDAEDVLQETFIEVMRSVHRYRGDGSFAGWIRKVAASKALMKLRSAKLRETEEFIEESPGQGSAPGGHVAAARAADPVHAHVDLETALARLPERARAVVWLHDVEGYTHEEIGEMMGMTPSFSKSQLARAHARLRGWLEGGSEEIR